ncbi:MAG: succinylglutamate desuccinylase/aspartoacylase family protein [Alphaproteobacteria bacterium]|nr:succinylglutamate desuccinylase/aspartoacylase family protein [Alphaproteobacteria bacterium]
MRLMTSDPPDLYAFAPDYGVFVPEVRLGDEVDAGTPVGRIHNLEHPEREPQQVRFRAPGLVICLRAIGRVEPGDCLAHQAVDLEVPESLLL